MVIYPTVNSCTYLRVVVISDPITLNFGVPLSESVDDLMGFDFLQSSCVSLTLRVHDGPSYVLSCR